MLLYEDDMVLVFRDPAGLQKLLDVFWVLFVRRIA
jgi:hypothetical protein